MKPSCGSPSNSIARYSKIPGVFKEFSREEDLILEDQTPKIPRNWVYIKYKKCNESDASAGFGCLQNCWIFSTKFQEFSWSTGPWKKISKFQELSRVPEAVSTSYQPYSNTWCHSQRNYLKVTYRTAGSETVSAYST